MLKISIQGAKEEDGNDFEDFDEADEDIEGQGSFLIMIAVLSLRNLIFPSLGNFCAVTWKIFSTVEGVQHCGGISSVLWRVFSTCGGMPSTLGDIISTVRGSPTVLKHPQQY